MIEYVPSNCFVTCFRAANVLTLLSCCSRLYWCRCEYYCIIGQIKWRWWWISEMPTHIVMPKFRWQNIDALSRSGWFFVVCSQYIYQDCRTCVIAWCHALLTDHMQCEWAINCIAAKSLMCGFHQVSMLLSCSCFINYQWNLGISNTREYVIATLMSHNMPDTMNRYYIVSTA